MRDWRHELLELIAGVLAGATAGYLLMALVAGWRP